MGEGWSDWYAKDFLVAQFPALDTAAPGDVHMGDYTDATPNTIRTPGARLPGRRERGVCPARALPARRLHLRRLRQDRRRPEVHSDGEIWAADAVGPAHGDRLAPSAERLITQAHAALAAGAVVPGRAQRDPARRRGRGRHVPRHDLDRVRRARDGLLRHRRPVGDDVAPVEDFSPPPRPDGAARDDRRARSPTRHGRAAAPGATVGARLARRAEAGRRTGATRSTRARAHATRTSSSPPPATTARSRRRPSPRTRRRRSTRRCGATGPRSRGGATRERQRRVRGRRLRRRSRRSTSTRARRGRPTGRGRSR